MREQNDVTLFKKLLKDENQIIINYQNILKKVTDGNTREDMNVFIDEHKKQVECINNILLSKGVKVKSQASPFKTSISMDSMRKTKTTYDENSREMVSNLYRAEIKGAINSKNYFEEVSIELKPEMESLLDGRKKIIKSIEKIIEEK